MKTKLSPTVILPCSCQHTYQDLRYGTGKRLYNHAPKKNTEPTRYRCSVCKLVQNHYNKEND